MLCISLQPLTGCPPHPVWWFDSHLLVKYLNDIANLPTKWDSFSVYLGLCFFEKKCIVFNTRASTWTCLLHNKTVIKNIIYVNFSTRVFKKRLKCNATRKSCFCLQKDRFYSQNICLTKNVLELTVLKHFKRYKTRKKIDQMLT